MEGNVFSWRGAKRKGPFDFSTAETSARTRPARGCSYFLKVFVHCGFQAYWQGLKPDVLDATEGPSCGGGEEAALRAAANLKALGHDVVLFWYGTPGEWRGVKFRSLQDNLHHDLRATDWDAVVSFSDLRALEWAPKSSHGRRFMAQQLNDLWGIGDWGAVDCIISPSESHAQQLAGWGWKSKPYGVVHNGCDVETYRFEDRRGSSRGLSWNDRPMDVGYWSSPDRGLHHLLRAWPEVVAQIPTAKLHVFYEIEKYLQLVCRATGEYGARAQELMPLLTMAKHMPSVIFHGQVPRKKLSKTQLQCRVMCYPYDPTNYCEGFCHPPGTMIPTLSGIMSVERIVPGAQVVGGSGVWRDVTQVHRRQFMGKMYRVNGVEMTDDHPVQILRETKEWLRADELRIGMQLCGLRASVAEPQPKVTDIASFPYTGPVHSITVEADESYHVGNFLVHNCGSTNQALAAGCFTMLTPKDALPELYRDVAYWMNESPTEFPKTLAPQVVAALKGEAANQNAILGRLARWKPYTWDMAGVQLDRVIQGLDWKVTGP